MLTLILERAALRRRLPALRRCRDASRRGSSTLALLAASLALSTPGPAYAFDPFGLFGEEEPPPPSRTALPYSVKIQGVDDDAVEQALQDTSSLYRLRLEAPPDGEGLVRRGEADLRQLNDVLAGYGYYQGKVSIQVDGVTLTDARAIDAAARAAERSRARAHVPVRISVDLGPFYTLRSVAVRDSAGRPFSAEVLPERFTRTVEDVAARSGTVLAQEKKIVDRFRALGYPFAKAVRRDPVVDDAAHTMDVTFTVDPGRQARIGEISVAGSGSIPPEVVRSFIYTEPGDPYSPKAIADMRKSMARLEGLGTVRVREAETLDSNGNLPIFVEVSERDANLIGVSARYSTVDGPGIRAYYANRNLFGGGETFRIDADIYYLGLGYDPFAEQRKLAGINTSGLGGRVSATYIQPALWGTRNDFVANVFGMREVQQSYFVDGGGASVGIRHRFSDTFSMQVGLETQIGRSKDAIGEVEYAMYGVPVSLSYDSTDNLLDPTEGVRINASVTPYPSFFGSDPGIVYAKGSASGYYALDDEAKYVLAGRVGLGSVSGATLAEIPDNFRFFAGGGGSVRGFSYRTLGPLGPFNLPIGGRSLFEASLEARVKVTDTIGVVPFFDMGTAFASQLPNFDERIRKAAGLGLRYYTGIGPIRVDVAFPLDRIKGLHERPVALYISLGQAF